MPSSYTRLVYHTIFSTHARSPAITPEIASEMHAYLGGIIKARGGLPILVGGYSDHVHVLTALRADQALATVVRDLKANSSRWVHERFPDACAFAWQEGYAAFSVDPRGVDRVREYIAGQDQHHREVSFRDEVRRLLDAYGVAYDERYL